MTDPSFTLAQVEKLRGAPITNNIGRYHFARKGRNGAYSAVPTDDEFHAAIGNDWYLPGTDVPGFADEFFVSVAARVASNPATDAAQIIRECVKFELEFEARCNDTSRLDGPDEYVSRSMIMHVKNLVIPTLAWCAPPKLLVLGRDRFEVCWPFATCVVGQQSVILAATRVAAVAMAGEAYEFPKHRGELLETLKTMAAAPLDKAKTSAPVQIQVSDEDAALIREALAEPDEPCLEDFQARFSKLSTDTPE